jgi:hypothetical protein
MSACSTLAVVSGRSHSDVGFQESRGAALATAQPAASAPAYAPAPVSAPAPQRQGTPLPQPRLRPSPATPKRRTPPEKEPKPEPHFLLVRLPDGKQLDSSTGPGTNGLEELIEVLPTDAATAIADAQPSGRLVRTPYIDAETDTGYQQAVTRLRDEFRSRVWFTANAHHVAYIVPGKFEQVPEEGDGQSILGRYANLPVARCAEAVDAEGIPTVDMSREIERLSGIESLRQAKLAGEGVYLYVFDRPMEPGGHELVARGWKEELEQARADAAAPIDTRHSTMVAAVAKWIAPNANVISCPALGFSTELDANLRRIHEALEALLWEHAGRDESVVVVNSWAVRSFAGDAPKGNPRSYRYSARHPLTDAFAILSQARNHDFVFASGNCGATLPASGCDQPIPGEGQIAGANASAAVLTVAACDAAGRPRQYTSEGPGTLHVQKPDIACPTDYTLKGRGVGGSSGAAPLAAGVLACLRSAVGSTLLQETLRHAIRDATRQSRNIAEHSILTGWGLIDADATLRVLRRFAREDV